MANTNERPPLTKPFTIDLDQFEGASVEEAYNKSKTFEAVKNVYEFCNTYANAYN